MGPNACTGAKCGLDKGNPHGNERMIRDKSKGKGKKQPKAIYRTTVDEDKNQVLRTSTISNADNTMNMGSSLLETQ